MNKVVQKLGLSLCLIVNSIYGQIATQTTETFSHGSQSFQMQFVKVGDAGNLGKNLGLSRNIGSVNYEYWVGKIEVDAFQIGVGNSSGSVGITVADWNHREFTYGSNPPATGISLHEAARFVNWMNISKGYSPAYKFANNYGPIDLYGTYTGYNDMMKWNSNDAGYNQDNPFRNSQAHYFLPSIDEWFKAAYYDPTLSAGDGGYWKYATKSNMAPNPISGGTDGAVYNLQTGPANVDNAGSLSWYGTMAQGGNIWELQETAFDLNNDDIYENRTWMGGAWSSSELQISSQYGISREPGASNDEYGVGFRVAMLPEPSALSLLAIGLGGWAMMRRRRS